MGSWRLFKIIAFVAILAAVFQASRMYTERAMGRRTINVATDKSDSIRTVYQDSIKKIQEVYYRDYQALKIKYIQAARSSIFLRQRIKILEDSLRVIPLEIDSTEKRYRVEKRNNFYRIGFMAIFYPREDKLSVEDFSLTAIGNIKIKNVFISHGGTAKVSVETLNPIITMDSVFVSNKVVMERIPGRRSLFRQYGGVSVLFNPNGEREFLLQYGIKTGKYSITLGLGEKNKSIGLHYWF